MSYKDQVKQAAAALKRGDEANWELARLTYENTNRNTGPRLPDRVDHKKWAADVHAESGRDFSEFVSWEYAGLWGEHGGRRDLPTFATAREAYHGRQKQDQLRYDAARVLRGPAEVKRQQFRDLAADPEVVDDLPTRTEATKHIAAAVGRTARQGERQRQQIRQTTQHDPEYERGLMLIEGLKAAAVEAGEIWRTHSSKWTADNRALYEQTLDDAAEQVTVTQASIKQGIDWDAALQSLTQER